jgi:hypothetical protein
MASRTISEIYNAMIAEKESFATLNVYPPLVDDSQTMLNELTTTSKVGIWRLIMWVCAVAIWIHEGLWVSFEIEMNAKAELLVPGTIGWWTKEMKRFQYGDSLIWDDVLEKWKYAVSDTTKQIITQAAVVEAGTTVTIKVAKSDGSTGLEKLSSAEYAAALNYMNAIKFAGTLSALISDDPDYMKLTLSVYVDTSKIYNDSTNPTDPLNGSLISDSTIFPIVNAINEYISTLDFNGKYFLIKQIDSIQSVDGVSNVVISVCQAKYGSLAYANILTSTEQSYQSNAGYLVVDPTYPLITSITYLNKT